MNTPTFHSEYGEDRYIFENLPLPENGGVYVDVGCAFPVDYSNTAFLRELGWTGVAIDANPVYAPMWAGLPFVNALISDRDEIGFKCCEAAPVMSRVSDGAPKVKARTLRSVLDEFGITKIDFLSIDVEGHEFEVVLSLRMLGLEKMPATIISEHNTAGIGEDFRVKQLLEGFRYDEVHRTIANIVYKLRE